MTDKNTAVRSTARRPKRKLLDLSGPLACHPIDGYHLRWVAINCPEHPYEVEWAEGQGYEPVTRCEQSIQERSQDAKDSGSDIRRTGKDGVTLMLMKQPLDYYEESIKEIVDYNQEQLTSRQPKEDSAVGLLGQQINISNHNVNMKVK